MYSYAPMKAPDRLFKSSAKQLLTLALFFLGFLSIRPVVAEQPRLLDPFGIFEKENLFGEILGTRPYLENKGVTMTGQLVNDMLWNTTGGISPGGADDGLLQFGVQVDTEKAFGLPGGTFKNTWFWLYGRNPSGFVGDVNSVSGIAGNPAFRCYELWYEQNLAFGGFDDAFSLRGGLLGLDAEFCIPDPALLFINGTFGFPALMSQNLANSGPQYPMATPGVRLALHPFSWLRLRGAITQANPFSQAENLHNFNWNFGPSGGLLSMNEAEVAWGEADSSRVLSGKAKAGFWIQNGPSPTLPEQWSFGPPSSVAYCTGFYGLVQQTLYRPAENARSTGGKKAVLPPNEDSDDEPKKGLESYFRVGFSPQPASPLSIYTDAGLVYTGLLPTRSEDQLGLAFCYGEVSQSYRSLGNSQGIPGPSFESVVELTYSIRLTPCISLQPDLQYVLHPGGSRQYGNALVAGFRAIVDF
jgi:porin